ncbi:MAG: VacJ family lipoprotein [Rhodobacteraceae bacterium]|nr:VacJ family lipoprotein [Paracoccaceae bacterium]MCC0071381.1 VacJ family lipoprotein [Paracoccaceae bacterium]
MLRNPLPSSRPPRPAGCVAAVALLLAGCAVPEPGAEFNDPYETQNRAVHEANLAVDRAVFGGGKPDRKPFLPAPLAAGLGNFSDNLGMPAAVLNSLLQGRPDPAVKNAARFLMNTTVGLGGILDPATAVGLHAEDTDFGETLHVWGAPEGAFLVVPLAGPTTERDLVGKVVDFVIDPMNSAFPEPEKYYVAAGKLAGKVADRQRYGDVIDDILYGSADSYAQMRLMYLQNRHYELGIEAEVFDPYEDPYGQ